MPCNQIYISVKYSQNKQVSMKLCASNAGNNVDVRLTQYGYPTMAPHQKTYWTMYLQRYTNGSWRTIGTRAGYVSYESPSPRTFNNVRKTGARMRCYVKFNRAYLNPSAKADTIYTPNWTR